jgi:hypothetical protein
VAKFSGRPRSYRDANMDSSTSHHGIRAIRPLLGDNDVKTTMTYTPVLNCGPTGVRSPMHGL